MFLAVSALAGFFQMAVLLSRLFAMPWEEFNELHASSFLLLHRFKNLFVLRLLALVLGSFVLPFALFASLQPESVAGGVLLGLGFASFLFSLAGEFLGRYLFFVTVVPKNIPGSFFTVNGGAH